MIDTQGWSSEQLATLPAKNGFRQRGREMTRLETFTDAAFAFAVTLLVVGGGDSIPANFEEMLLALKQIPTFAASFAIIMLFWYAHHIWSRRFGLEDAASVLLSLVLIFLVLIFVYPLKAIYSGAFQFLTNGYLDSYFSMNSINDLRSMFVIFGLGYGGLSSVIVLLNRHAISRKTKLSLSKLEIFDTRTEQQAWVISLVVAITSVILALVLPDNLVVLAGPTYAVFGILLPWHGIRRGKTRPKV